MQSKVGSELLKIGNRYFTREELEFTNMAVLQDMVDKEIEPFISQVENDAIEKTNKRWSDNSLETLLALNNDGSITIHDQSLISRICKAFELKHEKNLFIKLITSDLLEYKERV